MTGPIHAARTAERLQANRERRETRAPWYIHGPIPPRPEPTGTTACLPTKETIDYYQALPTLYGTSVAMTLASMSIHRVPFTPELIDYLEAKAIRDLRQRAARVAGVEAPLMILGETGTGKELLAQAIHAESARAERPFVGVNIAAVPETLLEAEFFGVAPGAYTGAELFLKLECAQVTGSFKLPDGRTAVEHTRG